MPTTKPPSAARRSLKPAGKSAAFHPEFEELFALVDSVTASLREGCYGALRVGMRLMHLHNTTSEIGAPGGFRAAVSALGSHGLPRSTAYRWINAAGQALMRIQSVGSPELVELPAPDSPAWRQLEAELEATTRGLSLRRLALGSASPGSDESRLDTLISSAEAGDSHAAEYLDRIAAGEMTLVQAIRAQAGATATKNKSRKDPIYLDLDGRTGEPVGLFPKSLLTLSNAFRNWDSYDSTARTKVKAAWKALVANLPSELR